MKQEINSEDLIRKTAIAAARSLKIEADAAFNDAIGLREEFDNAKRRLAFLEGQHRDGGLYSGETTALFGQARERVACLEIAVAAAEARCREIAADRLERHDQMIAEATAKAAEALEKEEAQRAIEMEENYRAVKAKAHQRIADRQARVDAERAILESVASLQGAV